MSKDIKDPLYQELMTDCDIMGIPLEEADLWYNAYVEFVREELNERIDGKTPVKINTSELLGIVMNGLINKYEVF